jgi:F-type H+-transporting ATPase subunit delta
VSAAAERYARAIFELGVETGQLSALGPEIERLARAYQESSELQGVLSDPLTTDQRREAMLGDLAARLGVSELANNALRVLGARRRLSDEQSGILRASVVTAGEMPESFFERLKSELEAATGRKIVLEHSRDPSLIAGVVTRIGDNTIDGSIKGRLAEIERRLLTVS